MSSTRTKKESIIMFSIMGGLIIIFICFVFYMFSPESTQDKYSAITIPEIEKKRSAHNSKIDRIEQNRSNQPVRVSIFDNLPDFDNKNQKSNEDNQAELNTQAKKEQYHKEAPQRSKTNTTSYRHPKARANQRRQTKQTQQINSDIIVASKKRKKRRFSGGQKSNRTEPQPNQIFTTQNIPVKVHGDYEKLKNRSKIVVRTSENCVINNNKIPRNTLLSGITNFSENRINIEITGMHLNGNVYPVRLYAYSLDGIKGIWVEGGLIDDSRRDANDEIIDEVSSKVNIPIIKGVVKSVIKKSNREITVPIPKNYPLILKTR